MAIEGATSNLPISNVSNKTASSSGDASSAMQGMMQKDDFLKLFLASLQYQDPMSPMDNGQMMEQMTQLTMIEQVTNMSKAVDKLGEVTKPNPIMDGVSFLDKEITGTAEDGSGVTGMVDEVRMNKGALELIVNNKTIDIGSVLKVATPSVNKMYENAQL